MQSRGAGTSIRYVLMWPGNDNFDWLLKRLLCFDGVVICFRDEVNVYVDLENVN